MEKEEYIKKWLEGSLTEEESKAFQETEDYKTLTRISESLISFKAPDYNVDQELAKLKTARKSKEGKQVHWFSYAWKVAAAVILLFGFYIFFFNNNPTVITTGIAEKTTIYLPDSSMVLLNAESSVSYNESSWEDKRELHLVGEAFFTVAKGSKFKVITNLGTVQVLGTEFNVKERASLFEVICYEGLVQVQSNNNKYDLPPHHLFMAVDGEVTLKEDIQDKASHLASDESAFFSVPFDEVIKEFERQYEVNILAKGIKLDRRFTGRFTHSDVDLALKAITLPMNLSYRISDDKTIILQEAR